MIIRPVSSKIDAERLTSFLLDAPQPFATPLTPGEACIVKNDPLESLASACKHYFLAEDRDSERLLGVIGARENQHQTGIYEVTCIAVVPECRGTGIGKQLMEHIVEAVKTSGGRGILVDTSDHPDYAPMHRLLRKSGFREIAHIPEFYYPGEGTVWYYMLLQKDRSVS